MKSARPWPASALRNGPPDGKPPAPTDFTTTTGKRFDVLAPSPETIDIGDIATALARLPRWLGRTHTPFSVAQHAVWVSQRVTQRAAPYALLHDAHRAFAGDIPAPAEAALTAIARAGGYDRTRGPLSIVTDQIDRAILTRFGLIWPMPAHIAIAVKFAELEAMATEKRDLRPDHPDPGPHRPEIPLPPPAAETIKPLPWGRAHDRFMARFAELFGEGYA